MSDVTAAEAGIAKIVKRDGPAVTIAGQRVEVEAAGSAPIIVFDIAPCFNTPHGNIGVTLVSVSTAPTEDGQSMLTGRISAVLRTSQDGARDLIGELQRALLALAPAGAPDGPKN